MITETRQKFCVAYNYNGSSAKPSFWAPEQKYPLGIREELGVEKWSKGALCRGGVYRFVLPRIGVMLDHQSAVRTLKLICGNDFIDRAIAALPGRRLYGEVILDAFLWRGYPDEP